MWKIGVMSGDEDEGDEDESGKLTVIGDQHEGG